MIGRQVRKRRKDLGLTQRQLAQKSTLEQFHISLIENEHVKQVQTDTLKKLARALDTTTDWLLEMDTYAVPLEA